MPKTSRRKDNDEIIITDHAIIRYLERIYKLDVNAVKEEILHENIKKLMAALRYGKGEYPGPDHRVRMENKTIITIIKKNKKVSKTKEQILALFKTED